MRIVDTHQYEKLLRSFAERKPYTKSLTGNSLSFSIAS